MNIHWLNLELQEEYNSKDQTEALVPQGSNGELPLQQIFDMDILPAAALSGQRPGSVAGLVSQPSSPSGTHPTTPTILHQPATPTASTSHSDLITAAISSSAACTTSVQRDLLPPALQLLHALPPPLLPPPPPPLQPPPATLI